MTNIPDNFNDPRGRFISWTSLWENDGDDAFLTDNEHVDLRVFDSAGFYVPRPIIELDQLTMDEIVGVEEFNKGSVTISIGSPALFTNTTHGLAVGSVVYFTTTGELPDGVEELISYYVVAVPSGNTFRVSDTPDGSPIDTTGTQSGTHTLFQRVDDTIYDTVIEMSQKLESPGEGWIHSLDPSEGGYGIGTGLTGVTIGHISSYKNWRGLQATTDGVDIDVDIISAIPVDSFVDGSAGIDVTDQDVLSIVFPDFADFDDANCYIQLSSHESGGFDVNSGNSGGDELSTQVAFTGNLSSFPELRLDLSSFAAVDFNPEAVTGVKIHLEKVGPAAAQTLTIMGMRALKNTWSYRTIDFNTRTGVLTMPVTLDGDDPDPGDEFIPIIRGDNLPSDPRPTDGSLIAYFNTGGRDIHTGVGEFNTIDLIFRERRNTSLDIASHVVARILWSDDGTWFETEAYDYDNGITTLSGQVNHPLYVGLERADDSDPSKGNYLFRAELVGNEFLLSLYKTDEFGNITEFITENPISIKSTEYEAVSGRVGIFPQFIDRDASVDLLSATTGAFATMVSKAFPSRTPVKGVQINAEYSRDSNLFRNWEDLVPAEFYIDKSKTTSGFGSRRTESGLVSNLFFVIDDWENTYIELDIWVGSGVSESNQPLVFLSNNAEVLTPSIPILQPNTWNHIFIDLGQFKDRVTGEFYQMEVSPRLKDGKLGYFWVDSTKVGKRTVIWEARANSDNPWRALRDMVNDPAGALHFGHNERGRELQIRAIAISQDGWVGRWKAVPTYATLGAPLS